MDPAGSASHYSRTASFIVWISQQNLNAVNHMSLSPFKSFHCFHLLHLLIFSMPKAFQLLSDLIWRHEVRRVPSSCPLEGQAVKEKKNHRPTLEGLRDTCECQQDFFSRDIYIGKVSKTWANQNLKDFNSPCYRGTNSKLGPKGPTPIYITWLFIRSSLFIQSLQGGACDYGVTQ